MGSAMAEAGYDVAVVGAGVVGCAVARRFVLGGARVLLLEKESDLLAGVSRANSAILHTGFDAPGGSLELACMQRGYAEYLEIADALNLALLETGALLAAWNDAELERLAQLQAQARANGVADLRRLDRAEVLALEPHLAPSVLGGLLVPREHVIDPWSAPLAYLRQAVENGGRAVFDAALLAAERVGAQWRLRTAQGEFHASCVINCAGLWGDRVEEMLLGNASFQIRPRKGQFVVFDKAASAFLRSILLPVPGERSKGVVLARTVFGNLLVGPTAEEQEERSRAPVERAVLQQLVDKAGQLVPALRGVPVTAVYAGLRPASENSAYRLRLEADAGYLALGAIRSTGLTAALGLAAHAFDLIAPCLPGLAPLENPLWPRVPNLAEHRPRDWEQPGDNEIVCHCERVTRREIEAAFTGCLPARDLGGLKRRTRVCMGRCQGFYCAARVAELSAGHFCVPLAVAQRGAHG
ncbi:NAD(P)/FAD-dependent oxidoreductase [Verminephrobacter aporrectodeae]|uniref:NAD(P)/FAD-dependent oxidoreductase n=2 Tax=Verminephrobacter aporrectodeae TaxID=1110389 RepID=UPI002238458B|nr:NAD(P)/FAD-dependent oxidoreductase [Verminephrobacter aporrectodeae]